MPSLKPSRKFTQDSAPLGQRRPTGYTPSPPASKGKSSKPLKSPKTLASFKAPSQRMLQVGEELRHMLAGVLRSYRPFRDKALEVNVTVTEVRMSPDLRYATVFVMPLGGQGDVAMILDSLKRNASGIGHMLAGKLFLKFIPALHFVLDTSLERARRIDSLLKVSSDT